jgi:hypothetical protein
MTKYGNLVKGVVAAFMMMGIVACSMVPSPPVSQIAPTDHATLAAWYESEAAHLRQQAKDNAEMEAYYRKHPVFAQGQVAGGGIDVAQHCEALIAIYMKAAEQADQLAKGHRAMVK